MWSRKRILKKERKKYAKKRILFVSLICGGVGILLGAVGFIVLSHEPIFTSPLPFMQSIGFNTQDETMAGIKKFFEEEKIDFTEIKRIGKASYQITDNADRVIYISSEKDLSKQLSSLQRIVSRLTMEGKKYTRLDLRFDKPIIVL
jgi:hypothetical protein